jgi:hypothetical protein
MHTAAAIFFVAGAMVPGAGLLGLMVVIATGTLLFMVISSMVALVCKGRMKSRPILAVANGIEIGCKHSQQE